MQKGIGEYQIKKAKASKKEILKVLQDGKWHRYNEIKKATGLSSATLSKHLEELTNGIVEKKLDLKSKEYPYPVLYRLKPFVFEKAKPIEPLFTKDYKLIRYDLHMLHHLCGMITLDFLRMYLENPKREREEIFNQAFENYVIERYRESVELLKQELLKEMEKEEKEVRKIFEKGVVELLEENLELYKKDYDLLLKEHGIAKGCDLPECAFVPRKLLEDAQKESVELKQKLQQLLNEFPSKDGGSPANWRVNIYSTREVDEWKEKFEELLKEEGE